MIPIRTNGSNFVYRGPSPNIGDAWVERKPGESVVYLTWKPSDEERTAIAAGAFLRLGIYNMEPIPPVSLDVTSDRELSDAGVKLRDRAFAILKRISTGPSRLPAGFWTVSADMWQALQTDGALDPSDGGIPALFGRPLMALTDDTADLMEYTTT